MFVCDLEVTTPFCFTLSLQQVNQLKGALPPPPPILTECHYVCYMTRIFCTHISRCSLCHYTCMYYTLLHASLVYASFGRVNTTLTTQCTMCRFCL